MRNFQIPGGLGDILVLGAALQKVGEPVGLWTWYENKTRHELKPCFEHHPTIKWVEEPPESFEQIKWVSYYPPREANHMRKLHTVERAALQIGVTNMLPTDVLDIYDESGSIRRNDSHYHGELVLISCKSHELNGLRRFIPPDVVNDMAMVAEEMGYEVKFIGDSYGQETVRDVEEMMTLMERASLFIGPLSFPYHLASCLHTPCLTFWSYLPSYKFSHFFNTTSVDSTEPCAHECEFNEKEVRDRMNCWNKCVASERFDHRDAMDKLRRLLA